MFHNTDEVHEASRGRPTLYTYDPTLDINQQPHKKKKINDEILHKLQTENIDA